MKRVFYHYQLVACRVNRKQYDYTIYEAVSIEVSKGQYRLEALAPLPESSYGDDKEAAWIEYRMLEPMSHVFGEVDFSNVYQKIDEDGVYFEDRVQEVEYEDDDKVIDLVEYMRRNQG